MIVIAFYPGGGGNRYLRKLQDKEFSTQGIAYDDTFRDQSIEYRYLLDNIVRPTTDIVLTHCMDYDRIQTILNPDRVLVIKTDLYKSLQREWLLNGHNIYTTKQNKDLKKTIVDLYRNIKTDLWPFCDTYEDFLQLPAVYQREVLDKVIDIPVELESAWSTIVWHLNYYQHSNIDSATVVNDKDFMAIITHELYSYSDSIFEFCWQQYQLHGAQAPIVDLYNQHILQQD
jgi:hypothetical protein